MRECENCGSPGAVACRNCGQREPHLREQWGEQMQAIHRLPKPPDEIGDGPDERVGYALAELARLTRELSETREAMSRECDASTILTQRCDDLAELCNRWAIGEGRADERERVAKMVDRMQLEAEKRERQLADDPDRHHDAAAAREEAGDYEVVSLAIRAMEPAS